jgi:hypothetical protein
VSKHLGQLGRVKEGFLERLMLESVEEECFKVDQVDKGWKGHSEPRK